MDTRSSNTWWDSYRETTTVTRRFRKLLSLVDNREDIASNMINLAKQQYPGKPEVWYLNKLIAEIQTESTISIAY